jgi:large subunit ribosomal protein L24
MAAKVRKGDRVVVTSGRDKGKSGEVLRVYPSDERVLVAGVNVVKRHQRQTARAQGGIVSKELPIHQSKIAHIDPKSGGPTRIGFKVLGDGRRVRFAKKSGEVLDV